MKTLTNLYFYFEPDNTGIELSQVRVAYTIDEDGLYKKVEQTIIPSLTNITTSVELYDSIIDLIKTQEGIV